MPTYTPAYTPTFVPTICNQTPFIITLDKNFLETHAALASASRELANAYANNAAIDDKHLQSLGTALWNALTTDSHLADTFNKRFNDYLKTSGNQVSPLIIQSGLAEIQQLPWEILHHPEQGFLGKNKRFSLLRQLLDSARYSHSPAKGPLKILLFTAITEDQSRLDVETKMANVQEALMPFIAEGKVVLKMPDDGRFSSFQRILKAFQPQLLFMSGHGAFHKSDFSDTPDQAFFLFEAEQGAE